ncbi:protein of unknown function (DUF3425) domain containing protein [Hyaloscypha variabilis]
MPCDDPDHEHPPWPVGSEKLLVIEACETKCGWCSKYKTGLANNLRVHARRHVANEKDLQKITIEKGKAGRKNVHMDKRRFPTLQAYNRNLEEPTALHTLDSLPSQARTSRIGDDVAYGLDRPGFLQQQSQHESGIASRPSHPSQQAPSCERSQEGDAPPTNVPAWLTSRAVQTVPFGSQLPDSIVISGEISSAPSGPNLLNPGEDFARQPLSISPWEAKPNNYPATCRFDKVCLDLIQKYTPLNATRGNVFEFSNRQFPHISALLSSKHHALVYPVAAAIASEIIYVFTVESLPEQIAILYLICSMIRWIITGSKEDYYSMPSWLRPGVAQIVTAHPIWVDMMPWPEARNRLCCDAQYHHNYEEFKNVYNETISINWPYEDADTLIRISPNEAAINPVFITHVRTNSSWTLGYSFLDKYPDFAEEVNIGKPRIVRNS